MSGPVPRTPAGMGMRLALDLGPLVVYFLSFALTRHDIFAATGLFIVATGVAMAVSRWRFGTVSAIQIFSGAMVLVLGGLTIWLHKDWIIKVKPTIYYVTVSALLGWGLATGRPMLKMVLGQAYPGLSDAGWQLLTRNWALFFAAMAVGNEVVWRNFSTTAWLGYKLWGVMPLTVLFALAHLPALIRHGLTAETAPPVLPEE